MTELGEAIAIGIVSETSVECPLNHDDLNPISSENEFVGDGGTLGKNMEAGKSTITYAPNKRNDPDKVPYPTLNTDKAWPIEIEGHDYPVTCAAHHLIPAQASLKKAKQLHEWMVYKHNPQPTGGSGGGPAKGIVWADVGYDVNGVENGVWLPGNYAVGGNGTGEWTGAPSAYPDNEQSSARPAPPHKSDPASRSLSGLRHTFNDNNRKAQYVMAATWLYNAQFHDSHGDYSIFVTEILDKIASLYSEKKSQMQTDCPKCKERFDKIKNEGEPTHFGLAHRLNGVSSRLKVYLVGKRGHPTVHTSKWGKYADHEGMHMVSSNSETPS